MLCEECRDELSSPIRISPEQIQLRIQRATDAALVDIWGRVHRLEARTLVGRQIENQGLAILEPSVSRHHAHLTLDNGVWTVRDLGSANGTFHDDKLIEGPVVVQNADRVRFGHIAFYIVVDFAKLPAPKITRTVTTTIRPQNLAPVVLPPPPAARPDFAAWTGREHQRRACPRYRSSSTSRPVVAAAWSRSTASRSSSRPRSSS